MQMNRLFEIIYLLLNRKNVTAKELAEHFEVSQRTIYRDIDALSQAGIPIYANKGKGGGICLMDNYVLNKSLLSDKEKSDILSALQGLKATNYPDTDQVLTKLTNLFGNANSDWIEVDFSYWNSNEEDKKNFSIIKEAILSHKVIQFDYYNSYGEESHRFVEPRKLIFKGQAWYLYGYCREKKDDRFFKLSRIKELSMGDETFQPRNAVKPIMDSATPTMIKRIPLELKLDAEMAFRVYDEFPKDAVTKLEDGSFLVHAEMQYGGWLYGYLMSFEDHLIVVKPDDIREELLAKVKHIINRYKI